MKPHTCKRFRSIGKVKILIAGLELQSKGLQHYLERAEADEVLLKCITCGEEVWTSRKNLRPSTAGLHRFELIDPGQGRLNL